jgi:3-hydroxyisobutyrate dehydrogenase-like beta-hydroxyacid dehydrogenase
LGSNSDFLAEAIALYKWAVTERKAGRHLLSESAAGEKKQLVLPRLERVAPEAALPAVDIDWSRQELHALQRLSAAVTAPEPTGKLIQAMRKQ